MKTCPYCYHKNPEENQYCVKCGVDMVNYPVLNYQCDAPTPCDTPTTHSIWDKDLVKFVLYAVCILVPVIGLIFALLVSVTPFEGQKYLSSKLITCACIAMIVWFILGFIVGFIIGFSQSFTY